jgi:hypothetical protein
MNRTRPALAGALAALLIIAILAWLRRGELEQLIAPGALPVAALAWALALIALIVALVRKR